MHGHCQRCNQPRLQLSLRNVTLNGQERILTLDITVGVVHPSSLDIQSILVRLERAAVKSGFVAICRQGNSLSYA